MIKNKATLEDVIDLLNELLALDEEALTKLLFFHVECNEDLALHPSTQVQLKDKKYYVGLLGVLNGIFGINDETGWGGIVAVYDNKTGRILDFIEYDSRIHKSQAVENGK